MPQLAPVSESLARVDASHASWQAVKLKLLHPHLGCLPPRTGLASIPDQSCCLHRCTADFCSTSRSDWLRLVEFVQGRLGLQTDMSVLPLTRLVELCEEELGLPQSRPLQQEASQAQPGERFEETAERCRVKRRARLEAWLNPHRARRQGGRLDENGSQGWLAARTFLLELALLDQVLPSLDLSLSWREAGCCVRQATGRSTTACRQLGVGLGSLGISSRRPVGRAACLDQFRSDIEAWQELARWRTLGSRSWRTAQQLRLADQAAAEYVCKWVLACVHRQLQQAFQQCQQLHGLLPTAVQQTQRYLGVAPVAAEPATAAQTAAPASSPWQKRLGRTELTRWIQYRAATKQQKSTAKPVGDLGGGASGARDPAPETAESLEAEFTEALLQLHAALVREQAVLCSQAHRRWVVVREQLMRALPLAARSLCLLGAGRTAEATRVLRVRATRALAAVEALQRADESRHWDYLLQRSKETQVVPSRCVHALLRLRRRLATRALSRQGPASLDQCLADFDVRVLGVFWNKLLQSTRLKFVGQWSQCLKTLQPLLADTQAAADPQVLQKHLRLVVKTSCTGAPPPPPSGTVAANLSPLHCKLLRRQVQRLCALADAGMTTTSRLREIYGWSPPTLVTSAMSKMPRELDDQTDTAQLFQVALMAECLERCLSSIQNFT